VSPEQLLISKIVEDGDVTQAIEANISDKFFASPKVAEAWNFIMGYWTKHRTVPSYDAFRRKYPGFGLADRVEEPLAALIDEVFDGYRYRVVRDNLLEAVQAFEGGADGTDTALVSVQKMLSEVSGDMARSDVQVSDDFIGPLVAKYIFAEENTMPGIPTGFSIIDEACGGLQPEQLLTLIGLPKRMKSSFLLWMAFRAQCDGHKVGLVSFEMSNAEQQARYLSLGAGVPLTAMQRGLLSETQHKKLWDFEEMVVDENFGKLVLIHDVNAAAKVTGITALQEKHAFDILFIDGVYLMDDDHGEPKGSSQALTNITRDLKRFAQKARIPVAVSTQALFSKVVKSKGVQMDSVGYSSSFAQDSDILLGIDRDDLSQPIAKLKVIAARNALGVECEVSIDYTKGTVTDRGLVASADFDAIGYKDGDV
jgi:replicative DNA helicase